MNKQQRQIRSAVIGAVYYSFVIAIVAAAVMVAAGCMVQPVDSGTGQKIGGPVSALRPAPTTSPSGSPVVLQKTNDVDVEAVQKGIQATGGFLPAPWNVIVTSAGSAAAGAWLATRKKKSQ